MGKGSPDGRLPNQRQFVPPNRKSRSSSTLNLFETERTTPYTSHLVALSHLLSCPRTLACPFLLRDRTENVQRMLQVIEEMDVAPPTEYISEVIPVKYAKASEIANALKKLALPEGLVEASPCRRDGVQIWSRQNHSR